jgi:membrane-associated phospholipid phosphatase
VEAEVTTVLPTMRRAGWRDGEASPGAAPAPVVLAADRLDRLVWALTAAVAAVVALAAVPGHFVIAWNTFLVPGCAFIALLAGAWFYRHHRFDPKLASALGGTAQIAAFAAVGAPLSYIAASAGLPLQDQLFDAADRALGFDWPALLAWMNTHTTLHSVFCAAYLSFTAQATTTVLALSFTSRLIELRVFMLAFIFAALFTIAVSALLPAQGVWGHYGLSAADYPAIIPATREIHLPIFLGLRDGSFRSLVAQGSEGIITFPSLHAALGAIFIFALWPVPVLRWVGLAVNLLMIVATPVDGGHYFIDVLAGLAVAIVALIAARALAARAERAPVAASAARLPQLAGGK